MPSSPSPLPPQNLLGQETSPYLRQHAQNPVHWRVWGEAALAEAQRRNKPILLSVGYAACHWCHVMAHESFADAQIAAQMNRLFVNIKLDREERPDLDDIYMRALQAMGQPGGWPLTMFLTPEGAPFWGGTYFPPTAKNGMPGFPEVLEKVAQFYQARPQEARAQGAKLSETLARPPERAEKAEAGLPQRAAAALLSRCDSERGGLAGAPKFPQFLMLEWLWRMGFYARNAASRQHVLTTLTHICQGGIYDHIGGGLCRYAVDAEWRVPHFEKMLYDNALFLRLLALVWADTKQPLFLARARETVAWLAREMLVEDAFAASLDADSDGAEGRFYIWDYGELAQIVGAQGKEFADIYGASPQGNFEGANVLHLLGARPLSEPQTGWAAARQRLFAAREKRVHPARDHKLLADWNGLMIAALCDAARVFHEPAWLGLAQRAFASIVRRCGDGARLHHVWCAQKRGDMRFADDAALMSLAALRLYGASGRRAYLQKALAWSKNLADEFWDEKARCYHKTPKGARFLLVRPPAWQDDVSPSANAAALRLHQELFLLTGESAHEARADMLADEALRRAAANFPMMTASLDAILARPHYVGASLDVPAQPIKPSKSEKPHPLWRALHDTGWPDILPLPKRKDLPASHPAASPAQKAKPAKRAALSLCPGRLCLAPLSAPQDIAPALQRVFPQAAWA